MLHWRTFVSAVIASAYLLLGCGQPEETSKLQNVFGNDNREAITTSSYPWGAIGKLSIGCTGTLVARDLVLTAAHCVLDSNTKRLRSDLSYFYPNYKNGTYSDRSWISRVTWGTNDPDNNRDSDWAIMRLQKPLGDKYGWLGIHGTTAATFPNKLTIAGYSQDFRNGETAGVHHNCNTRRRGSPNNMIYHDCDMTRGASGGPVLRMLNNRLTIYGLNVAEKRSGADQSLHLSAYDDSRANIAIGSEGFLRTVKNLIESQ